MVKEKYAIACAEVLTIINNMSEENKEKIPLSFIDFLEDNKDSDYIVGNLSLKNASEFNKETRIIMALIYRDFFLSKEEREIKDKEKKEKEEKEYEKYSYENLFKKEIENVESKDIKSIEITEIEIEKSLVEIKEKNKFVKILNNIKDILKKIFNK